MLASSDGDDDDGEKSSYVCFLLRLQKGREKEAGDLGSSVAEVDKSTSK